MPRQNSSRRDNNVRRSGANYVRRSGYTDDAWAPNRNMVRNNKKAKIGPIWRVIFSSFLVIVMGMIYVSQCSGVTTFDHEIASTNAEIMDLEAERDALAVENAKIHAAASTEGGNEVASSMANAVSGGHVAQ